MPPAPIIEMISYGRKCVPAARGITNTIYQPSRHWLGRLKDHGPYRNCGAVNLTKNALLFDVTLRNESSAIGNFQSRSSDVRITSL
jgi:hypothetical protein